MLLLSKLNRYQKPVESEKQSTQSTLQSKDTMKEPQNQKKPSKK